MSCDHHIHALFNPRFPDPVELSHVTVAEAFEIGQSVLADFDQQCTAAPRFTLVPAPGQHQSDAALEQAFGQLSAFQMAAPLMFAQAGQFLRREITARSIEIERCIEDGDEPEDMPMACGVELVVHPELRDLQLYFVDPDADTDSLLLSIPQSDFTVPTELIDQLTPTQAADFIIRMKQTVQAGLNSMLANLSDMEDSFFISQWLKNSPADDPLALISAEEISLEVAEDTICVLRTRLAEFNEDADEFCKLYPTANREFLNTHPMSVILNGEISQQEAVIAELTAQASLIVQSTDHTCPGCCKEH